MLGQNFPEHVPGVPHPHRVGVQVVGNEDQRLRQGVTPAPRPGRVINPERGPEHPAALAGEQTPRDPLCSTRSTATATNSASLIFSFWWTYFGGSWGAIQAQRRCTASGTERKVISGRAMTPVPLPSLPPQSTPIRGSPVKLISAAGPSGSNTSNTAEPLFEAGSGNLGAVQQNCCSGDQKRVSHPSARIRAAKPSQSSRRLQ